MRKFDSEKYLRAAEVIKCDRMGISDGIEGVINYEISKTLSDYFSLDGKAETKIEISDKGYVIKIIAKAKSVHRMKII